ncbi:hypothetical protein Mpal_2412 [Methanosphaerula palustris E1-9c]|uniref:DUF3784 domain-containing protein n=2 Tax=Methanosphaerula palustris TaxID=475088 RepID=B8GEJ1_METPE|nr:hypothetical protein Mpal_2412 [Methanosphaerula palustris E1-9c]
MGMASVLLLLFTEILMIFFLGIGYLIRFKGKVTLVAGYDPKRVRDSTGLSTWIGNSLLLIGVIGVITFLIEVLVDAQALAAFFTFALIIVPVVSIVTAWGARRFYKKEVE